ncbi:MAG: flavin reductase family protein [Oscillochloris sp.]|nr:flavin reductase family protein [Oscillochloris sp.]
MEINPQTLDQREVYKLLIGCVVPRPIAWVSTSDEAGNYNLAPYSFFNAAGSNPPTLTIAINYSAAKSGRKDTLHNILTLGEFVINIVSEETAAAMNETSADVPADVDEFALAGLTPAPSRAVRPPRVAESPVSFECTLHTSVPVGEGPGSSTIVIGIVRHIYLRDDLLNERGYVQIDRLRPIGRLAGSAYCRISDIFDMPNRRS